MAEKLGNTRRYKLLIALLQLSLLLLSGLYSGCLQVRSSNKNESDSLWIKTGLKFDLGLRPQTIIMTDPDNIWVCAVSEPDFIPPPNLPVSVFYSHDRGQNWGYYNFEGSENCQSGYLSGTGSADAWIFIDDIGLMKTSDGGKTWVNINERFRHINNLGLHFFDNQTGFALFRTDNPGSENDTLALFRSTDGGHNWMGIPSYRWEGVIAGETISYRNRNSITHAADTIGFATTAGRIFISSDKGSTWKISRPHYDPVENFTSLYLTDSRHFGVVSDAGRPADNKGSPFRPYYLLRFFRTNDGGISWMTEKLIPARSGNIISIPGTDSMIAITSATWNYYNGSTLISINSGNTFRQCDPYFNDIRGAYFWSPCNGFAVSSNFTDPDKIYKNEILKWNYDRTDKITDFSKFEKDIKMKNPVAGKQVWIPVKELDFGNTPGRIKFTDSLNIWIVSRSLTAFAGDTMLPRVPPRILKSNDGGETWSVKAKDIVRSFRTLKVFPLDSSNAWLYSDAVFLMKTGDGGNTWTTVRKDPPDKSVRLQEILFFDKNEGLAIGYNPDGISMSKTYNGGAEWTGMITASLKGERINAFGNTIGDTIAFSTVKGRIWISFDRGKTWEVKSPLPESIFSIALLSSMKIVLASYGYLYQEKGVNKEQWYSETKVLVSEDGGETWNQPVYLRNYCGVCNIPGNDSVIIATSHFQQSSGGTFISTNGGKSFHEIDSLQTDIATRGFYSVYHGIGISYCLLHSRKMDKTDYIYRWNPEVLFRKKILPR